MAEEKIYILKLSEHGLDLVQPRENPALEEAEKPQASDIQLPRWPHWSQRKLARLWYATLLGMNIEPTLKARAALKLYNPEKYQTYRDRLDIAKTLIGYELELYEDHMREGDSVGEKYISLAEYYDFAKKNGWKDLEDMRKGLNMDTTPPVLSKRKENNFLELLHGIFYSHISDFSTKTPAENATAILDWLGRIDAPSPVSHQTMSDWVRDMKNMLEERAKKQPASEEKL
jgi:hypothetical protein